jgi:hypothetical protein
MRLSSLAQKFDRHFYMLEAVAASDSTSGVDPEFLCKAALELPSSTVV